LAEESNLPEQNQTPVFKAGESFNRKELNKEIMIDPTGVDIEEIKKVRSGEKVVKEAKDFFRKNYKEILNELDPDSEKTPWYYEFSYSPANKYYKEIGEKIAEGEALDGANDIIPMAKKSAEQKVTNAKALKTGTVTEIVDLIGTKEIEGNDGFTSVTDEFNSKIKDEKNSFETLYKEFKENLDLFNQDLSTLDEKFRDKIFSPENNAIISALAKALKEEGIENESVNVMAERFEENIEKLLEKISGPRQKIEAAKDEASKKEETTEKPEVAKSGEKLGEKMGEKMAEGGTPAAPTPIETPKATETTLSVQEDTSGVPTTTEIKTEEAKLTTPKVAPPTTKPETPATAIPTTGTPKTGISEEAKGYTERAIEGIFGGMSVEKNKEPKGGVASVTSSSPALSAYNEMIESLFEPEFSSMIPELGGTSTEKTPTRIAEESTKIAEKILPKSETPAKERSIKEIGVQKLTSPLQTPVSKPDTQDLQEPAERERFKSQDQISEESTETKDMETEVKNKSAESQAGGTNSEEGSDLSEKLSLMVNLLSQLNDTLQNPLIVTSTTKNF